ncbi:MAG: 5'-nucleotidase [Planctomycetes bacterium]|nr:5'-nucleotidase [Planctomycetota bacterium]
MPLDLSDTLVVGITSTALFDLTVEHAAFCSAMEENPDFAIETYRAFVLAREDEPLEPGTGYPLIRALLGLNRYMEADGASPLVEVVVMSRNSPETGLRVLNSIRSQGLETTRSAFTGGESVVDYLQAFNVDLFLTTNPEDAQRATDAGTCATAVLLPPPSGESQQESADEVRIAFDGDAVLFNEESEIVFKTEGLERFHETELAATRTPMLEGPYANLLRKLARLQDRIPARVEYSPVRISIVTARDAPADRRVVYTLRHWGIYVDQVFFLGGLPKGPVLKALRPHIFFDDQDRHLDSASLLVPSGKVPYPSGSQLRHAAAKPKRGEKQDETGPEKANERRGKKPSPRRRDAPDAES